MKKLEDKAIAILASDGFEEIELTAPLEALSGYGATVHIVSDKPKIRSWRNKRWSSEFESDKLLEAADVKDYDMVIIPGGVINADKLRRNEKAIDFIQKFDKENKPIGAICHGPQLLIEAGLLKGKTLASHHAIKTDIKNAGAIYKDINVLKSENIISARGPEDIPAFLKKLIGVLEAGEHDAPVDTQVKSN